MRQERTVQASIFDLFAGHEIGRELKAMSAWLDDHRELLGLVAADLRRHGLEGDGPLRPAGGERAALCGAQATPPAELPGGGVPSGGLGVVSRVRPAAARVEPEEVGAAQNDSAIRAETWEQINRALLTSARQEKLESGRMVRVGQHGHRGSGARAERQQPAVGCDPGDGALAAGGAGGLAAAGAHGAITAERRRNGLGHPVHRGRPKRVQLYRELINRKRRWPICTGRRRAWRPRPTWRPPLAGQGRTLSAPDRADHCAERAAGPKRPAGAGQGQADQPVRAPCRHHRQEQPRGRIRSQAQPDRRSERLDPRCGDRSGNPADSERLLPMLERHIAFYGQAPRQAAADAASPVAPTCVRPRSRACATWRPQAGRGLRIENMVRSRWIYRAPQLPRRHRGRHLVPQARLRPGALHLARARPLPGLRLVRGGRLQSRAVHPSQADPTSPAPRHRGLTGTCRPIALRASLRSNRPAAVPRHQVGHTPP